MKSNNKICVADVIALLLLVLFALPPFLPDTEFRNSVQLWWWFPACLWLATALDSFASFWLDVVIATAPNRSRLVSFVELRQCVINNRKFSLRQFAFLTLLTFLIFYFFNAEFYGAALMSTTIWLLAVGRRIYVERVWHSAHFMKGL